MPMLLLVRHASAGTRGAGPSDRERPLDERGLAQAAALPALLLPLLDPPPGPSSGQPPEPVDVRSSPARRCVETVEPLARALGAAVEVDVALLEGCDVRALHARIATLTRPTVWASHGDVIPELLGMLARRGLDLGPAPSCRRASTWAIEVHRGEPHRARLLPPPA